MDKGADPVKTFYGQGKVVSFSLFSLGYFKMTALLALNQNLIF